MSSSTTVMIQFDAIGDAECDEDTELPSDFKNTEKVQEIVRRLFDGQEFRPLMGWGGACAPQADEIYGACFNYFLVDEFMAELAQLDWVEPDRLRVFVQCEEEYAFSVWIMECGAMIELISGSC